MKTVELTNWHEIKKNALAELGVDEFDRRVGIAHAAAAKIAADPSWFAKDDDRKSIEIFMGWRLQSLAARLGAAAFAKFEAMDHDTLGIAVVKMIESGTMI
jgi:uncharacterized small protein (DUF1192 family)